MYQKELKNKDNLTIHHIERNEMWCATWINSKSLNIFINYISTFAADNTICY